MGRKIVGSERATFTCCTSEGNRKSNTFWPLKQEKPTTKQIKKREFSPRGVKKKTLERSVYH